MRHLTRSGFDTDHIPIELKILTDIRKKTKEERLLTYRYPDYLDFDKQWISSREELIAEYIAKHTAQSITIRHGKRRLHKTPTEVDKALG